MFPEKLKKYTYILASKSPRRYYLLKELGIDFTIVTNCDIDEVYPESLSKMQIPIYLAELKAKGYIKELHRDEILITADTIVWLNNELIGKPKNRTDAIGMLKKLSGNMHEVITGVCFTSYHKQASFTALSEVYFKSLLLKEIHYYVDTYKPFDKAGAYGIQEWIGYIGVEKIIGSYFNVMGLPIQKLYMELLKFINT